MTIEVKRGRKCLSCDVITLEDGNEPIKLYECGNCGTIFSRENSADGDSHRCPDCLKFASVLRADGGCPECQESELEDETDVWVCTDCDETFESKEDADSHEEEYHPEDEDEEDLGADEDFEEDDHGEEAGSDR